MVEERPQPTPPEEAPGREDRPRWRTGMLVFLGIFLLLVIVFRAVLFPFLLAMFIAYLIEPLVAAFTRSKIFGLRWTRGPTIVLLYVVLLGGLVLASSCAVTKTATKVKEISRDVAAGLSTTARRAHFTLDEDDADRKDVRIPAGTRVALLPVPGAAKETEDARPKVFTTLYDVVLPAGVGEAEVLLEATEDAPEVEYAEGILDLEGVRHVDDTPVEGIAERLHVRSGETAAGLEVFLERKLITPIVKNLEGEGYHLEPRELRALLAAQAKGLGENLPQKITRWGRESIGKVALSIYEFILILMLTAFIVMDRKTIGEFFASLPPPALKPKYHTLMRYIDGGLAGVIRGQLVVCGVNGLLTYVGLLVIGVPGAWLLAIVAGILSLIPIFGTIISTIPIVLIAAADGLDKGFWALGWILLIHLVEANILNPLIMGSHARMHPVIIIFALLAGEHAFGVWGALLAVPTASILQSSFRFYRHELEGIPKKPAEPPGGGALGRLFGRWLGRSGDEAAAGTSET